jgi:hypothetical protein
VLLNDMFFLVRVTQLTNLCYVMLSIGSASFDLDSLMLRSSCRTHQ